METLLSALISSLVGFGLMPPNLPWSMEYTSMYGCCSSKRVAWSLQDEATHCSSDSSGCSITATLRCPAMIRMDISVNVSSMFPIKICLASWMVRAPRPMTCSMVLIALGPPSPLLKPAMPPAILAMLHVSHGGPAYSAWMRPRLMYPCHFRCIIGSARFAWRRSWGL